MDYIRFFLFFFTSVILISEKMTIIFEKLVYVHYLGILNCLIRLKSHKFKENKIRSPSKVF